MLLVAVSLLCLVARVLVRPRYFKSFSSVSCSETGFRYPRDVKFQSFEVPKLLDVAQSGIGESGGGKVQMFELIQPCNILHPGVRYSNTTRRLNDLIWVKPVRVFRSVSTTW